MQKLYDQLLQAVSEPFRHLAPAAEFFKNSSAFFLDRVAPGRTLSISLTDQECQQDCAHCNGHYLKGMQPFSRLAAVDLNAYDAVLVSGGSSKTGEVPIKEYLNEILQLPTHLRLNLHPGYQPVENLLPLKTRNPVVSFDLPTCNEVISEVFGLSHSSADYRALFADYCRHFTTIAHITIGLAQKDTSGEAATISYLAGQQPAEAVFLVFRPTPGTRMQNARVAGIDRVVGLLRQAMHELSCPVLLGCMRPAGVYRRDLDILAWMHGIRKIVMPDHKLMTILAENSITINGFQNCCALGC